MKRKILSHRIKIEGFQMGELDYSCYGDAETQAKLQATAHPNKLIQIYAEVATVTAKTNPPIVKVSE